VHNFTFHLCVQIQELTAEKDEMQQRAASLQHDKERLLGMVSRLELEKHTLESSMRSESVH
jgi:predicted nuclease with TOPRIM domain